MDSSSTNSEFSRVFAEWMHRITAAVARDRAAVLGRAGAEWLAKAGPGAHPGELILESYSEANGRRELLRVRAGAHWRGAGAGPVLAEWSMSDWMARQGLDPERSWRENDVR